MPPIQTIYSHLQIQDAIAWQVDIIMQDAIDPHATAAAQQQVLALLANIKDELTRQNFFDNIITTRKWKQKKQLQEALNNLCDKKEAAQLPQVFGEDEDFELFDESKRPKWISQADVVEYHKKGYFIVQKKVKDEHRVGFYSLSINKTDDGTSYSAIQITNFIITPLFHIYAGAKSRHMIKINNGYRNSVLDIDSAKVPAPDQFQAIAVTEGNFIIFGNKMQWLRIASDLLQKFPRCIELEELGYQQQGFFAYSDYIYQPGKGNIPVDNYGIFKFNDEQYLLPQQCEAYRQLIKTGGDPYENDRFLMYKKSPIDFTEWTNKMFRVFGIKSSISIAWLIFCLFRDIVMRTTSTSPHLYLYGPTGSGKSALANAVNSLFYVGRKPFIAYEGTIFAFYAYLSRFKNAPAFINEVDAGTTDMDRLQTIKGVFDGEGRERGKKDAGKRGTEIQKIDCGLLMAGQFLITVDDNSIINRSIIEDFLPNENRTTEDVHLFNELDEISKHGITSLVSDLLNLRPYFEANFRTMYLDLLGTWIKKSANENKPLVQRIMQNYCMMATCYKILSTHYPHLPVSEKELTAYCLEQARKWSSFVSSSDTLSEFWKFTTYFFDIGIITDGWDLIVKEVFEVELRSGEKLTFDGGKMILFLRLNNLHKVYQKEFRTRYNKEGMSEENLKHYFSSKKYYIGPVKQMTFKRVKNRHDNNNATGKPFTEAAWETSYTSCYAFLYDDIAKQVDGFNLLRETGMEKFEAPAESEILPSGISRVEASELFEKVNDS